MYNKPVIFIAIGYIIGILWGIYVKNICLLILFIGILLLINVSTVNNNKNRICRLIRKKIKNTSIIIMAIVSIIGFLHVKYKENRFEQLYKEQEYIVRIVANAGKDKYYNKYIGKIDKYNIKVYVKVEKNKELNYDDYIKVKSKIEMVDEAKNEYDFNYRNYLKSINVAGNIKITNEKINRRKSFSIGKWIYNIRESLRNQIYQIFKSENKYVAEALLLGDKYNLSDEIKENFENSGLSHLLAISGTHIAIITVIINKILKIIRCGKNFSNILCMGFLYVYIFIAGGTPSIIRSAISLIIMLLSKLIHRKYDVIVALSITCIINLACNPFSINNIGFILSYLAIFGVIAYNDITNKYPMKKSLFFKIKSVIFLSVCIQIVLAPILINNYQKIVIIGILGTVFATPILSTCIGFIIANIIISYIYMPLAILLANVTNIFITFFVSMTNYFSNIKFLTFLCTRINNFLFIIYYCILIYIVYLVKIDRLHIIKHFIRKNHIKIVSVLCVVLLISNIFKVSGIKNVAIRFIDVGQGDATLIQTSKNKNILIDGGGKVEDGDDGVGKNTLLPYLLNHGIKVLDYIIISHFDTDHCGASMYIMQNIKVKNIIIGKQFCQSENYEKFIKIVKEKSIKVHLVEAGKKIQLEKDIYLNILWPDEENIIGENIINNNSLVFKFIYRDFSMLFTGDIEKLAEERILKRYSNNKSILKSDILKIAHHGSKTSSIQEFLNNVKPKVSVIGVGENNKFGHPSKEVLERLKMLNCRIYRTDNQGEIVIILDKVGKIRKIKVKK